MKLIDRTQVAAVVLAILAIVAFVGVPRPYSVYLFWTMLAAALVLWLGSIWLRVQRGRAMAEAKAEAITTVGLTIHFFLVGWLVGFLLESYAAAWLVGFLLESYAAAWLFGFMAAIAGFILALAPLRKPTPRPPDSLPTDE
jgi:hypothetical protein